MDKKEKSKERNYHNKARKENNFYLKILAKKRSKINKNPYVIRDFFVDFWRCFVYTKNGKKQKRRKFSHENREKNSNLYDCCDCDTNDKY